MPFNKLEDNEECHHFFLECDVCGEEIEGEELDIINEGWQWCKLEGLMRSQEKPVSATYKTIAVCPKHRGRIQDLIRKAMYSVEAEP